METENKSRLLQAIRLLLPSLFLLLLPIGNGAYSEVKMPHGNLIYQGGSSMTKWSLGRLDFSLQEQFILRGRTQSIYHIDVETIPIQGKSAQKMWGRRVEQVRAKHIANGYSLDTFNVDEIAPGFSIVFYRENAYMPTLVTAEAYRQVPRNILKLKYSGKAGKEDGMRRLITVIANDYRPHITKGFNVGAGSLISQPSVNEHASATFEDSENHMQLTLYIHTAGPELSKSPLDSIDDEIKGLGAEGIRLKVVQRETRKAAGFPGEQGLVEIDDPESNEPGIRYTWFYAGENANSLKPLIRIQLNSTKTYRKQAAMIWNSLIDSIKIRSQ